MDPVDLLRRTPHNFHPAAKGEPWALDGDTLDRLAATVPEGASTLETGVGESTVVFLAKSARHIAIGPDEREAAAITAFCDEHGIPTDNFEFHVGISERVLPALELPPLDVVLIDGQHAFPAPFLDWYYTADHLRQGGRLVIDDVWIRTGKTLVDFLAAEPEWELVESGNLSAVFERRAAGPVTGKWWREQPWCHPDPPRARPLAELRNRVRLRTRLKSLRT
jgi:hypothetical protein